MATAAPGRRPGVIYGARLGSCTPVVEAYSDNGEAKGTPVHAHTHGAGSHLCPLMSLTPHSHGGELGRSDIYALAFKWG